MVTTKAAPPVIRGPIIRLPDPPERKQDEKMTQFDHLTLTGIVRDLTDWLGDEEDIIVGGERYVVRHPGDPNGRVPDLFVALNADVEMYRRHNGYIISEQKKPPDFVLEIASRSTGREDVTAKRDDYADMEIPEYWTFDRTGRYHGVRLGGNLLIVRGRYSSIPIRTLAEGVLEGTSPGLNVNIRWDHGELSWVDPNTGLVIDAVRRAEERAERRIAELEAELERYRRMS